MFWWKKVAASEKKLTLRKEIHQKNVYLVIIDILKMIILELNHMLVITVTMY